MEVIIGIGMALLFAGLNVYAYMTQDFSYDTKHYAQLAVSGGAAFYFLVFQQMGSIKSWFNKKPSNTFATDYSIEDFEALTYLRKRCCDVGSQKALDLVIELNDLLFQDSANNNMPIKAASEETGVKGKING